MPNPINFMAIVLVYFLLVYLLPVRRGRQPLLLWLLLIMVQAASVFCFRTLCIFACRIPFLAGFADDARQYMVAGSLAAINLLLIFLLNLAFHRKTYSAATDGRDVEVDVNDIQLNFAPEPRREPARESVHGSVREPAQGSAQEQSAFSDADFTAEPLPASDVDEAELFDSVQNMIDSGQINEAAKLLRVLAFFGTNSSSMERANKMLQSIEQNG